MSKVRVPKYLRPPKRYDAFRPDNQTGRFAVKGIFRAPKVGEFYLADTRHLNIHAIFVHQANSGNETFGRSRVILERVS